MADDVDLKLLTRFKGIETFMKKTASLYFIPAPNLKLLTRFKGIETPQMLYLAPLSTFHI